MNEAHKQQKEMRKKMRLELRQLEWEHERENAWYNFCYAYGYSKEFMNNKEKIHSYEAFEEEWKKMGYEGSFQSVETIWFEEYNEKNPYPYMLCDKI